MKRLSFVRIAALLSLVLVAGCKKTTPVENAGWFKSTSDIAVDAQNRAYFTPASDGPLSPIAAAPYGTMQQMSGIQPISITFNKPMTALGASADQLPRDVFSVSPSVGGKLRWEGTQTLVLEPDAPLPPATSFEVRLKTGLKALNGETLKEDFTWTFETPRPQVWWTNPTDGDSQIDPRAAIHVRFNQPVPATNAEGFLTLSEKDGGSTAFSVSKKGDSTLVVRPNNVLSKGKAYVLTIAKGIKGKSGNLGMEADRNISFTVWPELGFTGVSQGYSYEDVNTQAFDPAAGIDLNFSTPVRFSELRKAITISPSVAWTPGIEARDGAEGESHRLNLSWQPETAYTITIRNLKDVHGQTLGEAKATFKTKAFTPFAEMKTGLMVIESTQKTFVPIRSVNVDQVRVGMKRISADQIVPLLAVYDDYRYYPGVDEASKPKPIETTNDFKLNIPRNRIDATPLDLSTQLGNRHGVVAIRMQAKLGPKPEDERDYTAMAQVTNLGVSGKFSPHQNLIFVTDLQNGKPIPGAKVTIRDQQNKVRWTGTTDAQGRAQSPGWAGLGFEQKEEYSQPEQYAIVEKDGDVAFTGSNMDDGIEPYRFDMPFEFAPKRDIYGGSVFSDRGLYRAGEKIHVKGMFRKHRERDWMMVQEPVRALVYSPRNEVVFDQRFTPSEFGTLNFDWMSSPGADQGEYTMRIILASDTTNVKEYYGYSDKDLASGTFRIDSFRRATFSVSARGSSKAYVAGDFLDGTISGRYLFGASMAGQPVRYTVSQYPTEFTPPGFEDYLFGVSRYNTYDDETDNSSLYGTLAQSDEGQALDQDGMLKFRIPLKGNSIGSPVELNLEAVVTDPARQEGAGTSKIIVHPALFYVGLKAQTTFLELNKTKSFSIDVLTVDPNGAPVSGDVSVQLIKQEYNSVRELGVDGAMRWRTDLRESVKGSLQVKTQSGQAKRLFLDVPESGFYVVRGTGRDIRGNTVRSEAYFYATGEAGYVGWERRDDDRIEVVADHQQYAPGQTARLMIANPYETATALITIEREGILSSRIETLKGSAPMIEIPLTEEHLPNVFVSVMLISGRSASPTRQHDVGAPSFKIGYAHLKVDPGKRHLSVQVKPQNKTYRPGDQVTVDLKLVDQNGNGVPGEIAFSAADAGVLNLIDYKLPDPFEAFYGSRNLGVKTTDTRSILLLQRDYGDKEESNGGGGGNPNDLRRDFRPQASWNPALRTDGSGRVTVTFKLPESLTTFRLMAAAVTKDSRFGNGSEDIVVTKPLVMTPALPRFARVDDVFEAGVLVSNTTGKDGDVTVTASGENGLQLTSSATQNVYLKNGETKEVRFGWKTWQTGTGKLKFRAALGSEKDGLETTLSLQNPATRLNFATFSSTEGAAQEAIAVPKNMYNGSAAARLSSTALVGLDGATKYLFEYPYGCLEQRTSRIRPLLLGQEILAAFNQKALNGDARKVTEDWVNNLRDYWTGQGFSLWAGDAEVNPYVTAYALMAMKEAKDNGYNIPSDLVEGSKNALTKYVKDTSTKPNWYTDAVWQDTRAMMLYALAKNGATLTSELYTLAEQVNSGKSTLSSEGQVTLLRTLNLVNDSGLNRLKWNLLQKIRANIRVESTSAYIQAPSGYDWGWIYSSNTRATALGIIAMIETDRSDATRQLAEKMIRYLMQNSKSGWWSSTQDNVAVVEALAKYYQVYERTTPNFSAEVKLAGQSLLRQSFSGRSLQVAEQSRALSASQNGQQLPIEITKSGAGRLYYTLSLDAYTRDWLPAASNGISITRTIERMNAQAQPVGAVTPDANGVIRLKPGELVKITLRVQSGTNRNYVVVNDALPAGLEALNAAFNTTPQAAADTGESRWWGSFNHTEMRDDKVLLFADYFERGEHVYTYLARATSFGTFIYPPAQTEAMYQPEYNGRTRTTKLIVGN